MTTLPHFVRNTRRDSEVDSSAAPPLLQRLTLRADLHADPLFGPYAETTATSPRQTDHAFDSTCQSPGAESEDRPSRGGALRSSFREPQAAIFAKRPRRGRSTRLPCRSPVWHVQPASHRLTWLVRSCLPNRSVPGARLRPELSDRYFSGRAGLKEKTSDHGMLPLRQLLEPFAPASMNAARRCHQFEIQNALVESGAVAEILEREAGAIAHASGQVTSPAYRSE